MKGVYRDKKASVHWSAARDEERVSSRGQPDVLFPHWFTYRRFRNFIVFFWAETLAH